MSLEKYVKALNHSIGISARPMAISTAKTMTGIMLMMTMPGLKPLQGRPRYRQGDAYNAGKSPQCERNFLSLGWMMPRQIGMLNAIVGPHHGGENDGGVVCDIRIIGLNGMGQCVSAGVNGEDQ